LSGSELGVNVLLNVSFTMDLPGAYLQGDDTCATRIEETSPKLGPTRLRLLSSQTRVHLQAQHSAVPASWACGARPWVSHHWCRGALPASRPGQLVVRVHPQHTLSTLPTRASERGHEQRQSSSCAPLYLHASQQGSGVMAGAAFREASLVSCPPPRNSTSSCTKLGYYLTCV
jgi:hypothetical protein